MVDHKVAGLGYVAIEATDLDAWQAFGTDLLGFEVAERSDDRLRLRLDGKSYRFDIRKGPTDRVSTLGWEARSPQALSELTEQLLDAGYDVDSDTAELASERLVTELVTFRDPSGLAIEVFYGLTKEQRQFVSPTSARFVTGNCGLGHALQLVTDVDATQHLYADIFGFELSDHVLAPDGSTATFLHCNPRHHSYAFGGVGPFSPGVGHLMVEVDELDIVGRAYDKVLAGAAPLSMTLGRHTNDEMFSFYVRTPSGFELEYGYGGRLLGDDHCPDRFAEASCWGHQWVGSGPAPA
ncbi:VOC family protein [Nocardia miyunensis]|uniref:VOC family protein n=1 Tax=Nocardia miyunensis TaxID=282684 RepID=UPI00082FD8F3|nr:VOC family protein [Nocardia miyunensis]